MRSPSVKVVIALAMALVLPYRHISAQTISTWTPDTVHTLGGIFYWNNNNPVQASVDQILQNNWSCALPPNSVGAVANMNGNDLTQNETAWLSAATTIGVLNVGDTNSSNGYFLRAATLGTAGSLIFDNTGYTTGSSAAGVAVINSSGGTNEISAPITVTAGGLDVYNSSASPLVFRNLVANQITLNGGADIAFKSGTTILDNTANGTLVYAPAAGSVLRVDSGATVITTNGANSASNNIFGTSSNLSLYIAGTLDNQGKQQLPLNPANIAQNGGVNNIYAVTMDGGTLTTTGAANTYFGNWILNSTVTVGGTGTTSTNASNITGGVVSLKGGARTFDVNDVTGSSAADLIISSQIIGNTGNINPLLTSNGGGITKNGAGTLALTNGTNDFNGLSTVNAGAIELNSTTAMQYSVVILNANNGLTFSAGGAVGTATTGKTYVLGGLGNGSTGNLDLAGNSLTLGYNTFQTGAGNTSFGWGQSFNGTISNSVVGVGGAINKVGSDGQILHNAANTYSGGTNVMEGLLVGRVTSTIPTGTAVTPLGTGTVTVSSGATVQLEASGTGTNIFTVANNFVLNGNGLGYRPDAFVTGVSSPPNHSIGALFAGVGGGTFNLIGNVTLGSNSAIGILRASGTTDSGALIITGNISDGGSGYALTVNPTANVNRNTAGTASGSITLRGANTYTGTTTMGSGNMVLDFANSATASDILYNGVTAAAVNLGSSNSGGATLTATGKAATANSQTIGGLNLMGGANTVTATGGTGAGSSMTLNLGAITQSATASTATTTGSAASATTVNFTTSGTGPAITTTTANTIGVNNATTGYIGAWATFGGNEYAANSNAGGTLAAFTGRVTQNAIGSWAANTDIVNSTAQTGALGGDLTINSFKQNVNGASTVNLGGFTLTLNSGGIINNATTAANVQTISNGNLTSGTSAVYFNANGSSTSTISAAIVDNGASPVGFTRFGAGGAVTLSGANTYSGDTNLLAGTTIAGAANVIPSGAGKGNFAAYAVATFEVNGFAQTLNGLSGAGIINNASATNAVALTVGANNASSTFDGIFTSATAANLSLVKIGNGTFTLTNNGGHTYAGGVTINGGTLRIYGDVGLGANPGTVNSSYLTLNGGTLQTSASLTLGANRGVSLGASGGTFNVDANTTLTASGTNNIIAGTGSLTKTGNGQLTLGSVVNSYSGGTTLAGGTLSISNDSALGAVPGAAATNLTFTANSTLLFSGATTLNANRNVSINSGVTATFNTGTTAATVAGVVSGSGNVSVLGALDTPAGPGLNLTGINSYSGTTTIGRNAVLNVGRGTAALTENAGTSGGVNGALGSSSNAASNLIIDGGELRNGIGANVAYTTDRLFTMGVNGAVLDGGSGSLIMTNPGSIAFQGTTTTGRTIAFSGTTVSLSAKITDNNAAVGDKTGLLNAGTNVAVIDNAANSFTGPITINNGTVRFQQASGTMNVNGGAAASVMGSSTSAASNLVINGGTLSYRPSGTNASLVVNSDRLFDLGLGNGTIDATQQGTGVTSVNMSNSGAMGFNGQLGPRTLTLTGSGGGSASGNTTNGFISGFSNIAAQIGDNGGATTVSKTGSNSWTLQNAANNFTGGLSITGGFIRTTTVANGGLPSTLGAGGSAPENIILSGGGLRTDLALAASTDRLFTIGTGTSYLDSSGTAAVTYSNTGSLGYNGQTGTRTLQLQGSAGTTAAPNVLKASIGDNGGATTLTKTGTGVWKYDGTATYSGSTYILGGTLILGSNARLNPSSTLNVGQDGTLRIEAACTTLNNLTGMGALDLNGNTVVLGSTNANSSWTGTTNAGTIAKTGNGNLDLGGPNAAATTTWDVQQGSVTLRNPNAMGGSGSNASFANGTTLSFANEGFMNKRLSTSSTLLTTATTYSLTDSSVTSAAIMSQTSDSNLFGGNRNWGQSTSIVGTATNAGTWTVTEHFDDNALVNAGTGGAYNGTAVTGIGASGTFASNPAEIVNGGNQTIMGGSAAAYGTPTSGQFTVAAGALTGLEMREANGSGGVGPSTGASGFAIGYNLTGANAINALSTTSTATAGNTITVSSATGWTAGMLVSGAGIASGTAVVSVSGTTITLSQAAISTGAVSASWSLQNGTQVATQTATANATTGLTTIAFPSTTGFQVGMQIGGTGIPANTYITAVTGTSITISSATTAGITASTYSAGFNAYIGTTAQTVNNWSAFNPFTETAGGGAQTFLAYTNASVATNLALTGTVNISTSEMWDGLGNGYATKLDGVITGTGGMNVTGTTAASGFGESTRLILNSANTFSGDTKVNSGILEIRNSNALQNSTLNLTGTGQFLIGPSGATAASNGLTASNALSTALATALPDVVLGGLAGSNNFVLSTTSASNPTTTQDVIVPTYTGDVDLVVGGNNASTTYSGTLSDTNNAATLTKKGTGTLSLTGTASTYGGGTRIDNGVLELGSLANGGSASSIGDSSNAATNLQLGSALTSGTLRLTGTASTTDRLFTVNAGGGVIENNSSGALNFTNTATATLNGNLTLGGTSTATSTMSPVLSGTGGLTKTGTNTWVLTAANTYSGVTTVSNGTLQIGDGTNTTASLGVGDVVNNATLDFNHNGDVTVTNNISGTGRTVQDGSGILTLAGSVQQSNGLAINTGAVKLATVGNPSFGPDGAGLSSYTAGTTGATGGTGTSTATMTTTNYQGITVATGATLDLNGKDIGATNVTVGGSGSTANGYTGALINNSGTAATINSGGGLTCVKLPGTGIGGITAAGGAPVFSVNAGDTNGSGASVTGSYSVETIALNGGGSGYTSIPTVAITGTTTGTAAQANVTMALMTTAASPNNIALTNTDALGRSGSGYIGVPAVTVSAAGATATATMGVNTASITTAGTCYTNGTAYPLTFTGGGGTGAAGTATTADNGATWTITMTSAGTGYTSTPTFTIPGSNSGNTATGVVNDLSVVGVTVITGATALTSVPTVTIDKPTLTSTTNTVGNCGVQATANATLSVDQITLSNPGSGYDISAGLPSIALTGGGGSGAVVALNSVALTALNLTAGTGYANNSTAQGVLPTTLPSITVTGGGISSTTLANCLHSVLLTSDTLAGGTGDILVGGRVGDGTATSVNTGTAAAGITKVGAGTLTMSADNTYTGVTNITAGTVSLANGSTLGSIDDSKTIAIAGGATLDTGRTGAASYKFDGIVTGGTTTTAGTVAGNITITATQQGAIGGVGELRPGTSSDLTTAGNSSATSGTGLGTLTFTGNLTLDSNSTLVMNGAASSNDAGLTAAYAGGTSAYDAYTAAALAGWESGLALNATSSTHDRVNVDGTLNVISGSKFDLSGLTGMTAGDVFDLLDWGSMTGGWSTAGTSAYGNGLFTTGGTFGDLVLPTLAAGLNWDLQFLNTNGIVIVVAPEPTRSLLLLIGLAVTALRRKRK